MTNDSQKFFVTGQIEELGHSIPVENVLIEPEGKNTLPAICYGMTEVKKRFGKAVVGIFSSDHILGKGALSTISKAESLTADDLVIFGIEPECAHTGYGYIKPGEKLGVGNKVAGFREKPDMVTAEEYVKEGYLWNSGMFLFDTEIFFSELKTNAPDVYDAFNSVDDIKGTFSKIEPISIDYGIMERSERVAMVKIEDRWSDLGNFNSIYEEFEKDDDDNIVHQCESVMIGSKGNLVCSRPDKIVSMIDVEDMVVVDTPDALLICPRQSSQKVKDVVSSLKEKDDERVQLHQTVYRPWGSYTVLESSERHKIKNITVMPHKKLSLQMHHHRSEHWVVVEGIACVENDGDRYFLRQGESTFIKAGIRHRLSNPGKVPLEIIEVQLGDYVEEDDIIRFDDEYGRK